MSRVVEIQLLNRVTLSTTPTTHATIFAILIVATGFSRVECAIVPISFFFHPSPDAVLFEKLELREREGERERKEKNERGQIAN